VPELPDVVLPEVVDVLRTKCSAQAVRCREIASRQPSTSWAEGKSKKRRDLNRRLSYDLLTRGNDVPLKRTVGGVSKGLCRAQLL
jgi:hypothetical protein